MSMKKWRGRSAAIYARVAHESDKTATYRQGQVSECLAFAAQEGIVGFGNCHDLKGSLEPPQQRSGRSDMLKVVERGDGSIVVASDFDRISRDVACLEAKVAVLEQAGATAVINDRHVWAEREKLLHSYFRPLLSSVRSRRLVNGKKGS